MSEGKPFDLLLSLPPVMCDQLAHCEPAVARQAFSTFDPKGAQLGSGGGTAYVLQQAWQASGHPSFSTWLRASGKLILHGGGESRRLPPYAAQSKLLIPMPEMPMPEMPMPDCRRNTGHPPALTLLDLAQPTLQRLAKAAPKNARVMVASGDVLVRVNGALPPLPEADVVFFGLSVTPEEAQHFGVMFCKQNEPDHLVTFMQKPSPEVIREKSRDHTVWVDVGIWLLSERAVDCLLNKCGWDGGLTGFVHGVPDTYDLYGSWALHLGARPLEIDEQVGALTTAVVSLGDADFYHFGTCADLMHSVAALQGEGRDPKKTASPRPVVLHSTFDGSLCTENNDSIWVENSHIPPSWTLASKHLLTGVPDNDWTLPLERGVCLDFVPIGKKRALRVYGYDDAFRGSLDNPSTQWINQPVSHWFARRGITLKEAGIDPLTDLQVAPLFPVRASFDPAFVAWMFAAEPTASAAWKKRWLESDRKSARELGQQANLREVYTQRDRRRGAAAFQHLRDQIVDPYKQHPTVPSCTLLKDQLVWGRCPVRLDFAGGWSDTPPYCLDHGGAVLNIAVELNGQPPIQVFARQTREKVLTIRSIDLGLTEQLKTYGDVRAYDQLGSGFTLARAAFTFAGFHPDFNGRKFKTLAAQLADLGGGIEISMLAAVPKGSGLGTSSILAATLLGVLSDLGGLGWEKEEISRRTLALEQMVTSGGGWQDQVGGIFPGVKLIRTRPGLSQVPAVHPLPTCFFDGPERARMRLYYTGITRVAHDILGEIVRDMMGHVPARIDTVDAIAATAIACHEAIVQEDFEAFTACVCQSWILNQRLDRGTHPEAVQQIFAAIDGDLSAAKLLGAGGGGYLFMIAKDADAALRIQARLENHPPNEGARFVDFAVSKSGLQVTRS